jgi:hypothetical protein
MPARSSDQRCLVSDFCSSGRDFAPRFLQTVPRGSALARDFHPQTVEYRLALRAPALRAATALTRPSRSAQRLPFGRQNVPTAKRITSVGRLGGLRPYRQGVCDAVPQGVEALRGLGADEARRAIGAGRDDIALLAQIVDVDLIRLGE